MVTCLIYVLISFLASAGSFKSIIQSTTKSSPFFSFALFDFKLLISGTKNAYTSVRNNDILLYKLLSPIQGATISLGLYQAEEHQLIPLCNRELGSNEFHIDQTKSPLCADELKSSNRLLRIVSSDRKGSSCFVIDEYLDSDIHIPLVPADAIPFSQLAQSISDAMTEDFSLDKEITDTLVELSKLLLQKSSSTKQSNKKMNISTAKAPKAIGPYSQAICANGMVYVSGCIGFDPNTMKLKGDSIENQTVQALENLKAILESANSSLDNVCKTTILLKDMSEYGIVNQIYAKYFDGTNSPPPARTTYAVLDLPAKALIEIDAIAIMNNEE